MSILLGLASELAAHLEDLKSDVLLVFQAAEETTGGAKKIVDSGVFERFGVGKVYGLHLWPGYPKDTVICRKREFMASTMVFRVEIEGRSSHVANYRHGIDALEIGCRLVERVYAMARDEVAADVFRLLRFGIFESGTATNVVPGSAVLQGTLRTYAEDVCEFLWGRMNAIADVLMQETGCTIRLSHADAYPAVINPEPLYEEAKDLLVQAGIDFFELASPLLTSEDFSWYQHAAPGLFLHLGTGKDLQLHRGDYDIDEDVLLTGVRVFQTLLGIS
jgi:hippurate hydrolase